MRKCFISKLIMKMNFEETVAFLYNQLPVFQRQGKSAYKDNLDNTLALDAYFNHPHQNFKSIHVAGTNGKGSTSHMLASVLQEAGYRVGLYTSPHLVDMRERIKVNGQMMEKDFVVDFVANNSAYIQELKPSFFELMVMMSFEYFKQQKVDVAIMEVGMGGRLDSTNIINPEVSVITNIGLDHTQFLGDTLQKIAGEKAGIIKADIPVVIGESQVETRSVFEQKAASVNAPIYFAQDIYPEVQSTLEGTLQHITLKDQTFDLDLLGGYQKQNLRTALVAISILQQKGFSFSVTQIKKGLSQVIANTGLNGRWQVLQQNPLTVCDTGHNKEGLRYVVEQIKQTSYQKLHMVLGMVSDKDAASTLALLPNDAQYYLCQPEIPRAMEVNILAESAQNIGLSFSIHPKVADAIQAAQHAASANDFIFIGGSTFVVAEALEKF